jgi:16S rRNA processing protein RimM
VPKPIAKAKPAPLAAPKPTPAPETVGDLQPVPTFKGKAAAGAVSSNSLVMVGAVSGAFGVKGEVRVRSFTAKREGVVSYGPLHGGDGKVLLRPKSWRELKDGVAVEAPEVKTREAAEKLKGVRLFVPRANLPEAAEDEFYWVDLMGCHAEAVDGAPLGEVVAVWNFGAGDILELKPPNGGQNIQVSFTKQNVPLVDRSAKRIVIDPPAPEPTS